MLWLAVFFDSRLKYAFLEPLIKFLAFLVQKLCKNIPNMSGIPKGLQGISHINILPFLP